MPRPNILFITDDQHRYDFLEMTGKFPVKTPSLARLASEGVWHRNAYSTCPLCMPARASLHTGLYAHQTGLNRNIAHWPFTLPTMPRVLQSTGYHTAAIGKLHAYEGIPDRIDLTTMREQTMRLGYDTCHEVSGKALAWFIDCEWTHHLSEHGLLEKYREDGELRCRPNGDTHPFVLDSSYYQDIYICDRVVEWLDGYDDPRPFFLWAGLVSPHPPFDPPDECLSPIAQPLPVDNPDPDDWPVKRALYAAMVEIVDAQVGRMLQALERRNMLDDTLVIFVSDHGEMLGDHGLSGKCYPHDPSTRVPLLARYPPLISGGQISDVLVEITDLPATVLHAAMPERDVQSSLPASPGQSLIPHWLEPVLPHRPFVYSEDGGQFLPAYQMVRTADWKYVFHTGDCTEALFDMVHDPDECANLANQTACADIKYGLSRRLMQHLATTPPPLTP